MAGWSALPALLVATTLTLAGCGAVPSDQDQAGSDQAKSGQSEQADQANRRDPGTPSALDDMRDERFPKPLIDVDQILPGGPPPDGIPPIDEPRFQPASEVDWIGAKEPVLSLTVEGEDGKETRAYPLQIMTWHEIVNDTVAGVPVAVTYCPLCNSGVAFHRRADTGATERVLTFGTSGRLYASNLVMYDRQTESLWPQLTGEASVGVLTGTKLTAIPIGIVAWRDFRAEHPEAKVLSRDTGHERSYGANPYTGYDDPEGELLFGVPREDGRLAPLERVIGIRHGGDAVAILRSALADKGVLAVEVGGREFVVWHRPGQASALDSMDIMGGKDVGTGAVFDPTVDGRTLSFETEGKGFVDTDTGSRWNVLGRATSGPLEGKQLDLYQHDDTFWFAWVAFRPDTRLTR